ncbi:hypothetical protein BRC19_00480 [Candidatus Saccharibacteria bacterium QS_5_54_17]|nr:MAG: hypothetical protein BRC19_00480 [Candidatus Saccharibacteria bacterium QS_5_54_17]
MYFYDRAEAGSRLAESLRASYSHVPASVLAVSPGGVVVGREIASVLGVRMSLLLTEPVDLPGVGNTESIGLIDQDGHFTYNRMLPTGLVTEMMTDLRSYFENEKMQKLHKLTRAMNSDGFIDPDMFQQRHVIVVSDGFSSGLAFDAAAHYLKTVETYSVSAAAPNVSVAAVDRLHILADAVDILDVVDPYLDTDHYFQEADIPDIETLKTYMEWGA